MANPNSESSLKSKNNMKNLWSRPIENIIKDGLTDSELELIDQYLDDESYVVPWLFWTTELYSLGKCLREWLSWPEWLPIPVYGDHGVCEYGLLALHEQSNPSNYHLVWSRDRHNYGGILTKKRLLRIPHPWITYRHSKGYKPNPDRRGTLVFFPHSTMAIELNNYSLRQYMQELMELPSEYHPITLCLHRHDVVKKVYKLLRPYNIPIVSAGNTLSPFFIDRFYNLLSYFRYATSPLGGSELFYCYEFGTQFFIYGSQPQYINIADPNLPIGKMERLDIIAQKNYYLKMQLFRNLDAEPTAEKSDFVIAILGLDSKVSLSKIKFIFVAELIRLMPDYLKNNNFFIPRIKFKIKKLIKKVIYIFSNK